MKKQNNSAPKKSILHQRATALLKKNQSRSGAQCSQTETMKFIQEFELHQIELELQNQKLRLPKSDRN